MSDDEFAWPSYLRYRDKQHRARMFDVLVYNVRDKCRHTVLEGLADIPQHPVAVSCSFPSACSVCNPGGN